MVVNRDGSAEQRAEEQSYVREDGVLVEGFLPGVGDDRRVELSCVGRLEHRDTAPRNAKGGRFDGREADTLLADAHLEGSAGILGDFDLPAGRGEEQAGGFVVERVVVRDNLVLRASDEGEDTRHEGPDVVDVGFAGVSLPDEALRRDSGVGAADGDRVVVRRVSRDADLRREPSAFVLRRGRAAHERAGPAEGLA